MTGFTIRRLVGATLGGCAVLLSVVPARSVPARIATASSLRTTVEAGDLIAIVCGRDPGPSSSGTIFAAFSVTDDAGAVVAEGIVEEARWADSYVAATVGSETTQILESDGQVNEGFSAGYVATTPSAGTLRAAWARWGLDASCILLVNEVEVTGWTPVGAARYALPTDFTGGVAGSGITCLATASRVCAGAAVAVSQTYRYESSGYLFGLLLPFPGGLSRVQGPEGENVDGGPATPIFVADPSPGVWTFSLTATVSSGGPVLWILDVPA